MSGRLYRIEMTDTAGNKSATVRETYALALKYFENRYRNRRAWNLRRIALIGNDGFPLQIWDERLAAAMKD